MEPDPTSGALASTDTAPVIGPGYTYASVTDKISAIVLTTRTPRIWIVGFGISFLLVMLLMYAVTYLLAVGVPDRVVQDILGHGSAAMTRLYQHVTPSMLVEAGEALAGFWNRVATPVATS